MNKPVMCLSAVICLTGCLASISQADPLVGQNLLNNPGFESDTHDTSGQWNVSAGTWGRITSNPSNLPHSGASFFYSPGTADSAIYQEVDLQAWDHDAQRLLTGGYYADFGGWQRSLKEDLLGLFPRDPGMITLKQFTSAAVDNGTTPLALVAPLPWTENNGIARIGAGTTQLQYWFNGTRKTGGNNDAYLDDAYLNVGEYHIWTWGSNSVNHAGTQPWDMGAGIVEIGTSGTGAVKVTHGQTMTSFDRAYLGKETTDVGTVHLDDGTWNAYNYVNVGDYGTGTVNLNTGAWTTASVLLGSESSANGTVNLNGGTWNENGTLYVGFFGTGTVNLYDGTWNANSDVYVGFLGTGTVNLNGGTWTTGSQVILGRSSRSNSTVNLDGGTWNANGGVNAGANGIGRIYINPGGTMNAPLGVTFGIFGSLTLNGGTLTLPSIDAATLAHLRFNAGTLNLTTDNLAIGAAGPFGSELFVTGSQTLNVTNLATVEADGNLIVSGTLSTGGLTNLGTAVFIDATIGGPVTNPTGSVVNVVGNVTFTGLFSGGGGIFGSGTADFQGGFSPGDSPAIVTIEGSANLGASNTLFMEIGGLLAGIEFDVVDVSGTLNADGILDISLINAFAPSAGDSFDILNFGSITGNFGAMNLPTLGGGLDWDTSDLLVDGTLSVISTLLDGDLNGDGFVGVDDLNIVLINWNQTVTPGDLLAGDPSGEGFVGVDDLNIVLVNWNNGIPPGDTANIPEPGSAALLAAGMVAMLRRVA